MIKHHDTPSTTFGDERIRRLQALLAVMTDRYGNNGPMVPTIRRNLTHAEAVHAKATRTDVIAGASASQEASK